MPDPREPLGRAFHEQGRLAVNAERAKPFHVEDWPRRTAEQQELDMRGAAAVAAVVREQVRTRVLEVVATFQTHYAAAPARVEDLAEAVWQVLDRDRISDEEGDRPRVTVDLNVRVRKHETYSGFDDVAGADPAALRWGDRVLAVEVESRIRSEAIVTGVDPERRLVYLAPDWHSWRPEPGSDDGAEPQQ